MRLSTLFSLAIVGFAMWWNASEYWNSTRPLFNWDGRYDLRGASFALPTSVAEVQSIVRAAAKERRHVKVVGAGHSWSPIAAPHYDSVVLSLNELAGVVSVDAKAKLVTVRGGTRLKTLIAALRKHKLALDALPSVVEQSIAGALATSTHGNALSVGALNTFVTRIVFVDGNGDVREFVRNRDAEFDGAIVHLGALGVVVEVMCRENKSLRKDLLRDKPYVHSIPPGDTSVRRRLQFA